MSLIRYNKMQQNNHKEQSDKKNEQKKKTRNNIKPGKYKVLRPPFGAGGLL